MPSTSTWSNLVLIKKFSSFQEDLYFVYVPEINDILQAALQLH